MTEFLLEILSEDMPATLQPFALKTLQQKFHDKLKTLELSFEDLQGFVTPRRLCLIVRGLPLRQQDKHIQRQGPKSTASSDVIKRFLKSTGYESLDQCEQRQTKKGVFWFATFSRIGQHTSVLLAQTIVEVMVTFPWPKSMRWKDYQIRWIRPLQNILALFDGQTLPGGLDMATQQYAAPKSQEGDHILWFNCHTMGHRFYQSPSTPLKLFVNSCTAYKHTLNNHGVFLDQTARRRYIVEQARQLASLRGLTLLEEDSLLQEVTALTEWPEVLMGSIEAQFMDLPKEVLRTVMQHHQKYFATQDLRGNLTRAFLFVADTKHLEHKDVVIAGNERVLRARLSDAWFYWDQDRQRPLEVGIERLQGLIFHTGLGSMYDKAQRIQRLSHEIAGYVKGCDPEHAARAAWLSKADLLTGMVKEFPELQGMMGKYYALLGNENTEIAHAIAEHYSPQGLHDTCPERPVSVCVALVDKLDTLIGFFALNKKPSSSKDPMALRRCALGVIRLILRHSLRIPLRTILYKAYHLYTIPLIVEDQVVVEQVMSFFIERLKLLLRHQNIRADVMDAIFAHRAEDDLVHLLASVKALQGFLQTEEGCNLLVAYRRTVNIVRIEEKKDRTRYNIPLNIDLLQQPEEKLLFDTLRKTKSALERLLKEENLVTALQDLARLRKPLDTFFEKIFINVEDRMLRRNRLALLRHITDVMHTVAEFSHIHMKPPIDESPQV